MNRLHAPIFIVGCPRSGTTLLQQILSAHEAIAVAPETHFIRRFWLPREKYGDLENETNYRQLIDDIVAIPEFPDMGLDREAFRDRARSIEKNYASVFKLLLQEFALKHGAKIVGEKTPNHLLYMPILQQFFPEARFIHIIRDPRGVVNSWRTVPWSNGTLAQDARVWRRYLVSARHFPPAAKSLFTLHYEQLVGEPETCLLSVCQFIGIDYDSKMLDYYCSGSTALDTQRETWKTSATQPIFQNSIQRWQQELTAAEIAEIEANVFLEMNRYGYRPSSSLLKIVPEALWLEVKRRLRPFKLQLKTFLP